MILAGILAFGVMCLTAFAVGCGIAKLEICTKKGKISEPELHAAAFPVKGRGPPVRFTG